MAYSQAIVQRAMQRLQSENEQNEQSSRARIAVIYEKQPRLGEIERELRRTAAHVLAATFRRPGGLQDPKRGGAALPEVRRNGLCGRADVRMPAGALPAGAEEGAGCTVRHGQL